MGQMCKYMEFPIAYAKHTHLKRAAEDGYLIGHLPMQFLWF